MPTPNQTIEEMAEKCAEQITSLWSFKDTAGYPRAMQNAKQIILQHFDPLIRKAQNAELLKDKERLNWIDFNRPKQEGFKQPPIILGFTYGNVKAWFQDAEGNYHYSDTFRQAIDAAMAKQEGK